MGGIVMISKLTGIMLFDVAAPIAAALREAPEEKQQEVKEVLLTMANSKATKDGSLARSWNA